MRWGRVLAAGAAVTAVLACAPATPAAGPEPAAGRIVVEGDPVAAHVAQRGRRVLTTGGYRGVRRAPRTKPPPIADPVILGPGVWPDVHVDAAGTAHIVFNEDVDPPAPDVTHFCRLPRGARACDNPNGTPMPIGIDYASDDAGPRIFQLGDQLVVITHRYPPVVAHPDSAERDRTTYAWTSSDGGTTWTGPGIVGTQLPDEAALVAGDPPRIATITDTFTPGTFVQVLDAGSFTSATVQLGGPEDAYSGTIAADGAGIIAAFAHREGGVTVRRVASADAWTDAGAWSSAAIPGEELPRLASGPRGAYLLTRAREGWRVRRVDGGAPQAAVPISGGDVSQQRAFTADPAGGLYAALQPGDEPGTVLLRRGDGASWGGAVPVARANQIDDLALGALDDGGGVLAHRRDGSTIAVSAFGTLEPTGRRGAGGLAGEGIPGGYAGCREAGFGDLRIAPRAGCLLESADPNRRGVLVSRSEVDLNGLVLVPDAGVSILFDPRARTLDTTGRVRVLLRGPGIGDVELAHVELHARLGSQAGESLLRDIRLPAGPRVKGFPIDADVDVKLAADGVAIPVSLRLPPSLGGLSGSATLRARTGSGAVLESFRLSAPLIPLGPVTLEGLTIAYEGTAERWTGEASLKLPLGSLRADVTFERGAFTGGSFDLRPPRPGILVFKETYFTGVSGALRLEPAFSVSAGATFGFGYHPPPADVFLAEVEGRLTLTVRAGTAELAFTGVGRLYGAQVGQWTALMNTDGFARITGGYDLDLGIAGFDGTLDAFADAPSEQFGATFDATTRLFGVPISGGRGAISRRGVGACVKAPPLPPRTLKSTEAGVGWEFGGDVRILFGETCDLAPYTVPAPAGRAATRQAASAGGTAFSLRGGLRWANVEVDGDGGAPLVDVIAPDGRRITPLAPGAPGGDPAVSAVEMPEAGRTIVVLERPAAGAWQIAPRDGSPAIAGVLVAQSTGPPRVRGRVQRRGRARVLRYTVRASPGTTIRFVERGGASLRELGRATGARGTLRIAPAPGRGGQRTIEAIPEREGLPGAPIAVATYTAPTVGRPAAPRDVRVRGRTVSWRPVAGARGYVVTATLRSGRTVAVVTGGGARRVRLAGPVRRAAVVARDAAGRAGRPGRGRAG